MSHRAKTLGVKCQTAAVMRLMSDIGSMNFQAKFMSWSMRRRGRGPRIQMNMTIMKSSLAMNHRYEGMKVRNENGADHPPRKRVMAIPLMENMPMYSARKKSANLKPEYSM